MKDVVAVPYTTTYQLSVLYRASAAFRREHGRWVTLLFLIQFLSRSVLTSCQWIYGSSPDLRRLPPRARAVGCRSLRSMLTFQTEDC